MERFFRNEGNSIHLTWLLSVVRLADFEAINFLLWGRVVFILHYLQSTLETNPPTVPKVLELDASGTAQKPGGKIRCLEYL